MRVGFYAIVSVVAAASARAQCGTFATQGPSAAEVRGTVQARPVADCAEAMELGARNAVAVSMACAVSRASLSAWSGLTGLGLKVLVHDDRVLGRQPIVLALIPCRCWRA